MNNTNKKKVLSSIPTTEFRNKPSNLPVNKPNNKNVVFSFQNFKCISIKNKEFNNHFKSIYEYAVWSLKLINRISKFSTMKVPELLRISHKGPRCHQVTGKRLTKLKSILSSINVELNEQLEDCDYYELSLGQAEGRIFGYFIDNIYYIVLFDPHHLIYEQLEYGSQQDLLYRNFNPWKVISS